MDQMVLATQQWLNDTYSTNNAWVTIEENGLTGWNTIYALIRAFQIELGNDSPSGNLGPWTLATLEGLGTISRDDNAEPSNVIRILQGAMWCKGYWSSAMTGIFDEATENGIKQLQSDVGIQQNGRVNFYLWKSLLSMDQFVMLDDGEAGIREFQQYFNANYSLYFEKYVSCDGLAGRDLYTCFIYILQKDEGMDAATGTGIFGNNTYNRCPNISSLDASRFADTIKCLKIAIYLEGFNTPPYALDTTSTLTQRLINEVNNFNTFMQQSSYNSSTSINRQAIKQLFTSNGYTGRTSHVCDTATPINSNARAQVLIHNGYDIVGRYLTSGIINGENKQITKAEINILRNNGLSFFPIYQTSGNYLEYFSYNQGVSDAENAYNLAQSLSLPANTIIYFAVDVDVLEGNIPYYILPYFEGIYNTLINKSTYGIGVYGTRNICSYVLRNGYALKSFVGNMSTGYSGNMGFSMPRNWSFNQYAGDEITYNGTTIEIDKIDSNDSDTGVSAYDDTTSAVRRFSEEVLEGINLRASLLNIDIPLGDEITLASTLNTIITFEAEASYTALSGNDVLTITKNPNGSLSQSLSNDITAISNSFNLENSGIEDIETTLTTLCSSLPSGAKLKIGIGIELQYLVYTLIVSTNDFEFNNSSFSVSTTIKIKISPNLNNYTTQYSYALNFNPQQAWASVIATVRSINFDIQVSVDTQTLVVSTVVVIVFAFGIFYFFGIPMGLISVASIV